jgi:chemotaxis protein MotB
MSDEQPIIVIKKKINHGGHHGGAWKVAYADFVTAMMALFIVLWLMSSTSKPVQETIGGYFRDPNGTASKKGTEKVGTGDNIVLKKDDMAKLKDELLRAVHKVDNLDKLKKQVEITITQEGLRIELMEDPKGTFFELGSAQPTPILRELLRVLAAQMGDLPNKISIEGHTDAQPYSNADGYGNWELSADRANVARRLMQASGVRKDQVAQVRGFADQRLRKPQQPFDASNRRISLIVEYLVVPGAAGAVAPGVAASQAPAANLPGKEREPAAKPQPGTAAKGE